LIQTDQIPVQVVVFAPEVGEQAFVERVVRGVARIGARFADECAIRGVEVLDRMRDATLILSSVMSVRSSK
jgi:hypothetical protein